MIAYPAPLSLQLASSMSRRTAFANISICMLPPPYSLLLASTMVEQIGAGEDSHADTESRAPVGRHKTSAKGHLIACPAALSLQSVSSLPRRTAFTNICLVHALRGLGFPIVATRDGPFYAMGDGNVFLQPHGFRLTPVDREDRLRISVYESRFAPRMTGRWTASPFTSCSAIIMLAHI